VANLCDGGRALLTFFCGTYLTKACIQTLWLAEFTVRSLCKKVTRIISFSTKKAVAGVTGELAAACSRHLLSLKGGVAYAAVLAGSVAPLQPSGPLKPTAMHSDPSESVVLPDTSNGRISGDMSGPLSDMPDGTTASAQVTNTCIAAGECPNRTPIFISGIGDTRAFLAWLWASCPGRLTAQLKAEKLMVVPSTANGFRAAVRALRSIDVGRV